MKYPEFQKSWFDFCKNGNDEDNRLVVILNDTIVTSHFCWGLLIFGFTSIWLLVENILDKTMIDPYTPIKRDKAIVLSKFIVISMELTFYQSFALLLGLLAANLIDRWWELNGDFQRYTYFFWFCTTLTIVLLPGGFLLVEAGDICSLAFLYYFYNYFSQLSSVSLTLEDTFHV